MNPIAPVIDISHWRRRVNFKLLASTDVQAVIVKLTDGSTVGDPFAAYFARGLRNRQIPVGFYHYWRALADPALQTETLLTALEGLEWDGRPLVLPDGRQIPSMYLDCEDWRSRGRSADTISIRRTLNGLSDHSQPGAVGIYSRAEWWNRRILRSEFWRAFGLWIAHYGVDDPDVAADWKGVYVLHQHSERGQFAGVRPPVDLNKFPPSDDPLPAPHYQAAVTTSPGYRLRIRSGPGIGYPIVAHLVSGTIVGVYQENPNGFVRIHPTIDQWIAGQWLRRLQS